MLRRPSVERPVALSNLCLLTLLFALPISHFADAKQHQAATHPIQAVINAHHESPHEADTQVNRNFAATALTQQVRTVETPVIELQRKSTSINHDGDDIGRDDAQKQTTRGLRAQQREPLVPIVPREENTNTKTNTNEYTDIEQQDAEDESAIATLALDDTSVGAPSLIRRSDPAQAVVGSGITTPQAARSLRNWEVEDFTLLATIDGDLYALDRFHGKERWHLEVEQPMVETVHHRANTSQLDDDYNPVDHYLWAVEPNKDGGLYLWVPQSGQGLMKTGFTMKKLVEELSPYADGDLPVVYTGDKKTTMVTLDADSGKVLKWFGTGGARALEEDSCLRPNAMNHFDNAKCRSSGTVTLGRTEYTVSIQRKDGFDIATLKFSEWTPNNFDSDLMQQYSSSKDQRYVTTRHDGKALGLDFTQSNTNGHPSMVFSRTFPAPVARSFDVVRPLQDEGGGVVSPELVVLPQPIPPSPDATAHIRRSNSILLNQTMNGSWYALSARAYPLVLQAPQAEASLNRDEAWNRNLWDWAGVQESSDALIGQHLLSPGVAESVRKPYPTLPELSTVIEDEPVSGIGAPQTQTPMPTPLSNRSVTDRLKSLPAVAWYKLVEFVWNPVWVIVLVTIFFYYRTEIIRRVKRFFQDILEHKYHTRLQTEGIVQDVPIVNGSITPQKEAFPEKQKVVDQLLDGHQQDGLRPPALPKDESSIISQDSSVAPSPSPPLTAAEGLEPSQPIINTSASPQSPEKEKEKKAHRGRRGGTKHRKGRRREDSIANASQGDEQQQIQQQQASGSVEEAVENAKGLGQRLTRLEPDIQTLANGSVEEVTNPVLKIADSLQVDEGQQLGTGSNGTVVYAGTWDGRPVAVKRMLRDFYDIASQETKLLRESDDHPNVIRYYAQQQRGNFIYIALELCKASLADVVDKPSQHPELAQAGEQNMQNVLYQIANGLDHLHALRIVHRDLKPHNILVNMSANGKPRILVSDFGLCKKLEGGQSSFGATTAHAAGTSGWRAPELLLDDDLRDPMMADTHSSTHSATVSDGVIHPGLVPRRVTRSIDIFSLGLVFYYVLTKGYHPFDCGGRYMREHNIRKGNYNLSKLDNLGDAAYEAVDLIQCMIRADPKTRPPTQEVMAHPFFWSAKKRLNFLCDVSDHFEKEPRDPPSDALCALEKHAESVTSGDFLKKLPREFVDSLGRQRKYTGSRLLDLLRALRNKRNHYEDMPDSLKKTVGTLPDGYLGFWTIRFPNLLLVCWNAVYDADWDESDRFRDYYAPAGL